MWLSWSDKHGKDQRTPQRAAGRFELPAGDDPRAVATRLLKDAWGRWRRELGRNRVLLPELAIEDASGQLCRSSRDQWDDLHRTITLALRRTTPGEVAEVLSGSMVSARHVGRTAAARLWRLINSRRDTHGYRPVPQVRQAEHVTAWDEATPAERRALARQQRHAAAPNEPDPRSAAARKLLRAEAERRRVEAEQRRRQAEAERAAQFARWGLTMEPRECREPEHVHQEEQAEIQERRTAEQVHAAARAKARAAKGRPRRQADPGSSLGEQLAQRLLRNVRGEQ